MTKLELIAKVEAQELEIQELKSQRDELSGTKTHFSNKCNNYDKFLKKLYKEVKKANKMLWVSDDMIDQDTLFDLQDKLAEINLEIAKPIMEVENLVKTFPWLYKQQ